MNDLIFLATETSSEAPSTTDIIGFIVGVVVLAIAGVIIFFLVKKKRARSNDLRAKYYEAIVSYINNNGKNDYTVNEIRNGASIDSTVNDQTIANLVIELNNEKRLFRAFEYNDLKFHAINSELDDYPETLMLDNTATKEFKIGIDKSNKKVVFVTEKDYREFAFDEIISYEVYKQDKQILHGETKKSKSGAVVGGILFGGAGAIAGAATGKSKTTQTTQDLVDNFMIYVRTSQFNDPVLTIPMITKPIETNSKKYMKILEDSQKLSSVLDYIISVNDKAD